MVPDSVTSCPSASPTTSSPASIPTTASASTAATATTSTPNAFIPTSRRRLTGASSSPRRVPHAASPAIASAAAMATASGSSSASDTVIATIGRTRPFPATAPISPRPGPARRSATVTPIAISTGISANRPSITSVRGRRRTQRTSAPSRR